MSFKVACVIQILKKVVLMMITIVESLTPAFPNILKKILKDQMTIHFEFNLFYSNCE